MPLAIVLVALGLIAAGIRGSYKDLFALLVGDFSGKGSFMNWLAAIALVGCLGYVPRLQSFSRAFIGLIMVAVFLKQGDGLFDKFTQALSTDKGSSHPNPGANPDGGSSAASSSGSGGMFGSILNGLGVPAPVTSFITGQTTPTGDAASPILGAIPGSAIKNPGAVFDGIGMFGGL